MAAHEARVSTWLELHESLFEGSWNQELQRFRSDFAYRGMGDVAYELKTGLTRLVGNYAELEGHLLRNFAKYARCADLADNSIWTLLAVAQHHGLPTRLFDWTFSPYVALHFATADLALYDREAAIWCVDYVRAHQLLPRRLREVLEEEGANVFTVQMLNHTVQNLADLDRMEDQTFALFFEPPSLDQRIVNQYALLSMMSNPSADLGPWLEQHPDLWRKIVIPASLKWEIRDKLDQANITERVLFPGLDGLCEWLKRQYLPRNADKVQSSQVQNSKLKTPEGDQQL